MSVGSGPEEQGADETDEGVDDIGTSPSSDAVAVSEDAVGGETGDTGDKTEEDGDRNIPVGADIQRNGTGRSGAWVTRTGNSSCTSVWCSRSKCGVARAAWKTT